MKGLFSFPIYVQGLKRVRALGFITTACLVFINVVTTMEVNFRNLRFNGDCIYCLKELNHYEVFATDWMVVIGLFVPLVTFTTFSYLNKRSAADFYHSLPAKRRTVFISQWAASLTWTLGSVALCVGVNAVYWIAEGAPLHFFVWFDVLVCTSVLVLYLSACTALGVILTGNILSSAVSAILIGCLPPFVVECFKRVLTLMFPRMAPNMAIYTHLDSYRFLPKRMYFDPYGGDYGLDMGVLISFIFALALGALACLAYEKRQSETLSRPSVWELVVLPVAIMTAFSFVAEYSLSGPELFSVTLIIYLLCRHNARDFKLY